jgi:hypothetical protein
MPTLFGVQNAEKILILRIFLFSQELKEELFEWVSQYAKILEESDYGAHIKEETRNAIRQHNDKGLILFNKVKKLNRNLVKALTWNTCQLLCKGMK